MTQHSLCIKHLDCFVMLAMTKSRHLVNEMTRSINNIIDNRQSTDKLAILMH